MKILLLSDTHLLHKNPVSRIDDLPTTQIKKMHFVFEYAYNNKAIILQAGDLCDVSRSWYLLPIVANLFKYHKSPATNFYCIYGQHDTYMYSETTRDATIIGALEKAGLLTVLTPKPIIVNDVWLYGASQGVDVPQIDEEATNPILVVHSNISDRPAWKSHRFVEVKKYLKRNRFDVILCGDIHRKFKRVLKNKQGRKRYIVNTGPLLRTSATKYNYTHKPGFYVYDTKRRNMKWIEVPHKSAKKVLTREHIDRVEETRMNLDNLIGEIEKGYKGSKTNFRKNLLYLYKKHKVEKVVRNLMSEIMEEGK